MATGISGSNVIVAADGYPVADMQLIELRVLSMLIQQMNGNVTLDELRVLRNDQAFELGLPVPVPGN